MVITSMMILKFYYKSLKNKGKIIKPKTPISGVENFAICMDTEENLFAIIQLDKK